MENLNDDDMSLANCAFLLAKSKIIFSLNISSGDQSIESK